MWRATIKSLLARKVRLLLTAIGQELVRGRFLQRTHIGLDYFDASINRVAAWVIGTRNTLKALLKAMVEPTALVRACEEAGDYTGRLVLHGAAGVTDE